MSDDRQHHGGRQVFICHAGGDKETVARPLASALSAHGVSAWLDVDQLRIGDRLRSAIDSALLDCSIAVVVFSPAFFRSRWAAKYELDAIVTRFVAAELTLLPVLHHINAKEFRRREPSLGSCISRSTAEFTIGDIAREIGEVVLAGEGPRDGRSAGWPGRDATMPAWRSRCTCTSSARPTASR